jgi:V-type H+-transporting ATPase subunit D
VVEGHENVAGVSLPTLSLEVDKRRTPFPNVGVGAGAGVLAESRALHQDAMAKLVEIASLQTRFVVLDLAVRTVSRRVNALEFVVLPHIAEVIQHIKSEMDEMDREDFYRIKSVVEKNRWRREAAK